jgi:hypothetical protein
MRALTFQKGDTPLHIAVAQGFADIVNVLIGITSLDLEVQRKVTSLAYIFFCIRVQASE